MERPPSRLWGVVPWVAIGAVVLGVSLALTHSSRSIGDGAEPPSMPAEPVIAQLTPMLRPARLPYAVRVTLVRDQASVRFFDDTAAYDRELARWRDEMTAVGATVTMRAPDELAAHRDEPLVVPAAPCLSPATRAALQTAQARGQGALVTWLTGKRDGGCRDVGWGFIAQFTGAGRADTLSISDLSYVVFPAGTTLGLDMPPGARLELQRGNHVALRLPGRDAHYADAALNPAPPRGMPLVDAAVAVGATPRTAYLGFELGSVMDERWEHALARLLVRNAIAHIAGVPLAAPAAWPEGHVAAAVLAQDVEDQFANARRALDTLRAARVPATFFLVSELAQRNEALARDLARYGEVGSHSEDHRRLGGAPADLQTRRLAQSQSELLSLVGHRVAGFRPPEEQFDAATLAAWQRAGGAYVFATNAGRCAAPEVVDVDGRPLVLIGRVVDDDFIAVRRARIDDHAAVVRDQLSGFAKVRALGGLYVFSYHSNMLARERSIAALGMLARALEADSATWLTTTGEVARWWIGRHGLRTSVRRSGAGSLAVSVENPGAESVPAFLLDVNLPNGRAGMNTDGPPGRAHVAVPALAGGARYETVLATR